jgi:hypothetical protein
MTAFARGLVPALAAWLVPSAVLAVLYAQQGQHPAWGFYGGVVGVVGALASWGVAALMRPRDIRAVDLDEYLLDPATTATRWEHEGLARMHEDVARDAARHRDD